MLPLATNLPPLAMPLLDRTFKAHRKWLLHQQLPSLTRVEIGDTTESNKRLVNFVGQMVNEQKEAHLQAQEWSKVAKGLKLPSTNWGVAAVRVLCTLCEVNNKLELPQLWLLLADPGKRDRLAMEMVLTDIAQQKGQVQLAPIITPELVKRLVGMKFNGNNVEDLAKGIQPFPLTISHYTSTSSKALAITAHRRAKEYDLITNASVTTSLQERPTSSTTTPMHEH
jgi:hypothetical protein